MNEFDKELEYFTKTIFHIRDKYVDDRISKEDMVVMVEVARDKFKQAVAKHVIGEDDAYNDMCEACSNWDDGRNDLRAEQRQKLNLK